MLHVCFRGFLLVTITANVSGIAEGGGFFALKFNRITTVESCTNAQSKNFSPFWAIIPCWQKFFYYFISSVSSVSFLDIISHFDLKYFFDISFSSFIKSESLLFDSNSKINFPLFKGILLMLF